MDIPQPYAFNYHFDNGIFRGLAFANYRNREETEIVVQTLNGLELAGRKLRVEYKKVLPGQENQVFYNNEDIVEPVNSASSKFASKKERSYDKRESRQSPKLQTNADQTRRANANHEEAEGPLDLNHPDTLLFYDQLFQFRSDPSRDIFVYPKSTTPNQRRIIHYLSDRLGLFHYSDGDGAERQLHVVKKPANAAQLRGDGVNRKSSQRGGRNRLRQSQSHDRVRDADNGSPTRRENYRRSFISSSPLSDSTGTTSPNVVYPVRQPLGPSLENNFTSRTPPVTRKMSQLNLDAPSFEPAGLS
ncbi:Peptidyl-prolyl cis-trans isomerase pin4 [Umbelopsis nana]